jgi:hypothetical protein
MKHIDRARNQQPPGVQAPMGEVVQLWDTDENGSIQERSNSQKFLDGDESKTEDMLYNLAWRIVHNLFLIPA